MSSFGAPTTPTGPRRSKNTVVAARWLTEPRLYGLVLAASLVSSLAGVLLGQIPIPNGGDEFAYLLGAQTFAAGRLTNPPHPWAVFFETFHVLIDPSYMAKYPPAQSLVLALGYKLGHPIFGVWISGAAFAAATVWLLRARWARRWALLGGLLVALQFGNTHYYAQSYWGGAVAAAAGALILGATLRIRRPPCVGTAALLGLGVAVGLLSRPFETVLLSVVPAVLWLRVLVVSSPQRLAHLRLLLLVTAPILLAALGFQARLNQAVTGDWRQLPYTAYEARYSRAPLFIWQHLPPPPPFNNFVLATFYLNFVEPNSRFDEPLPTIWAKRFAELSYASIGPVLGLAAMAGLLRWPTRDVWVVACIIAVTSIGLILSYWFILHYYAGLHAGFVLLGVHGLRAVFLKVRLRAAIHFGAAVLLVLVLCGVARFAQNKTLRPFVTNLARSRQAILDQLSSDGAKHLIFVHRAPPFNFHFMWVYNDADIDRSNVVWAHDRGFEADQRLIDYYGRSRRVWLLYERADHPRLIPFPGH